MRSSDLALPTGWTPARPGLWLALDAIGLILGTLMAYGGTLMVSTEIWHAGASFGLIGLLLVAAVIVRRRRRNAPVRTDKGALSVGFSRFALVQGLFATVVGGAAAALFAITAWEGQSWLWVALCVPIAAGCLVALGMRFVRGISVGELRLSPHDLRLRVDHRDVQVLWEDVIRLSTAEMRSSYGIVTGRLLSLHFRNPPRGSRPQPSFDDVRVPIHRIDLDEVVLHHLLRFYREHPEARGELAGPAAVARLRDRAFPP